MTVGDLYGMQTFDQSLVQLYRNGLVERADAVAHAERPGEMRFSLDRADFDRERAVVEPAPTPAPAADVAADPMAEPAGRDGSRGARRELIRALLVVDGPGRLEGARQQRRARVEHVLELGAGPVVRRPRRVGAGSFVPSSVPARGRRARRTGAAGRRAEIGRERGVCSRRSGRRRGVGSARVR